MMIDFIDQKLESEWSQVDSAVNHESRSFVLLQVKQKPESQFTAVLVKFAHTYSPPQSNKLSTQVGITGPNWPGTHCRHNSYSPRSASIYTFG